METGLSAPDRAEKAQAREAALIPAAQLKAMLLFQVFAGLGVEVRLRDQFYLSQREQRRAWVVHELTVTADYQQHPCPR